MKIRRYPAPLRLYQGISRTFEFLIPLLIRYRLRKGKEIEARIAERKGYSLWKPPQKARRIWVHAASVGEFLAVLPLIRVWCENGLFVLLTTMTKTAALMAEQRLPQGALHQFIPFDTQEAVRRFYQHWQPDLGFIVESELWPNMLLQAKAANIPLFLLNARLSQKSYLRWKGQPKSIAKLLQSFDLILAQTPQDAERFQALKAPHVMVLGNLKFDVPPPPFNAEELHVLHEQIGNRPLWLAASTHPQEEAMILETHGLLSEHIPRLLTIIVPRHPDRGESLAQRASVLGVKTIRRAQQQPLSADCAVYIADTIGELGLFFRLSPFTYMGKSYDVRGGQNPIEPIKCGSFVFHGPHTDNFTDLYRALDKAHGAIKIKSAKHLAQYLLHAFYHEEEVMQKRLAAQKVVQHFGGALTRTLKAIDPYFLQMGLERE